MSLVLSLLFFCWKIYKKCRGIITESRYRSMIITNHFRKQGARIGKDCFISVDSLGTEPYLVTIGNHVNIAPGVTFHTHDGAAWVLREKIPDIRVFGTIIIEDNCMIGQNVLLLPDIRIGRNSIVGAGSVVISDIPPNSVAIGVPARAISSIQKYEEKCIAKWNEQKPPDLYIEQGRNWWESKENNRRLRRHLTKTN